MPSADHETAGRVEHQPEVRPLWSEVVCGGHMRAWVVALALICVPVAVATEDPIPPPPEVQTVVVTKDVPNGNVVLNWSDGVSPFAVLRSETPIFEGSPTLTYVTRSTAGGPVTDNVLADGRIYFYLVTDANTVATVYSITTPTATAYEGQTMTIDGAGFSSTCADNTVFFDNGTAAVLTSCSPTQIQAEIPAHAVSGNVVVQGPKGTSQPQKRLFAVGLAANPAKDTLAHIAVDTNHNLFIADQGASDRIWKIDFTSGAASTCTTFGNPVGLPRNENGKFNFGNDTWSSANGGTIRELDPAACTFTTWGTSGTATTDPVDPRALAYDKSGANNTWTFVLDHWGDRIRKKGNGPGLDTTWLTGLGLGGDTAAASRPAGLAFNTGGEFFFTAQSNIRHYNASKALVQSFTPTDGLNHPGQIETEGPQTLWVANRDANNVLRIRTNPADKLVRVKVSGVTAPRGVALDRDPVTDEPWVYVADQKEVYRFRVYDTVHLDVKVLQEALTSPSGTVTSQATFEARVRRDLAKATAVYRQCGVDVAIDRVVFIPDPNGQAGQVDAATSCAGLPTTAEQAVLGASRSTNPLAINVYYIRNYLQGGQTVGVNGTAYSNDCWATLNNQTQGGVMISRFSSYTLGGALTGGAIDNTTAHEVGHFLLDNFNNGGPGNQEHYGTGCASGDPKRFRIMHGSGCSERHKLTAGPGSECENIMTNPDESVFVERF